MINKIKRLIQKVKVFVKKNPLLSLIALAGVVLLINIVVLVLTGNIGGPRQTITDNIIGSAKSEGANPSPEDFPSNTLFLNALPEINEYFTANYLPLEIDKEIQVIIELYRDNSRAIFDEWIENFEISNVSFDYIEDSGTLFPASIALRRSHYATLLNQMPYNSSNFTIEAEQNSTIGVKFKIYYNDRNPSALNEAYEYAEQFNLSRYSLNITFVGAFLEPLDSIGD